MKRRALVSFSLVFTLLLVAALSPASAAGYAAYAYSLNSDSSDCDTFIDRLKEQSSNYSGAVSRDPDDVTQYHFEANTHNIKYWSSEGNASGEVWGTGNSSVSFNLFDLDLEDIWGGDSSSDLEFVFLAACNLINGDGSNPRRLLANAMIGPGAIRAICGYHESAPSAADEAVVDAFMDYAETGESVKSSWMLANEYVYNNLGDEYDVWNCRNYIVLTHDNNSQYSRFPGFPGNTYARPTSSSTIVRFSRAYQDGNDQELRSMNLQGTTTAEQLAAFGAALPDEVIPLQAETISLTAVEYDSLVQKDGVVSIVNDEIKDSPVTLTESSAQQTALTHILSDYSGLTQADLANAVVEVAPIVKAEVNLTGSAASEVEETVAYIVRMQNAYDGIPIEGSVFSVAVDDEGIPFSMGKWVNVQPAQGESVATAVNVDEVLKKFRMELVKQKMYAAQSSNEPMTDITAEAQTLEHFEVLYVLDEDSDLYIPVARFCMEDGAHYDIPLLEI